MAKDDAYYQAMARYHDGQLEAAVVALERVVQDEPEHADALEALGVLYGRLDRLDDAIAMMRRLAAHVPTSVMAHTNLSIFYMQKGLKLEAEEEKAIAASLAMQQGRSQQDAPEAPDTATPDLAERIAKFRDVLAIYPDDAELHGSLGQLYVQDERPEAAIAELVAAIELAPQTSAFYRSLGQAYEQAGRVAEAITTYQRGIAVAEQHGDLVPLRVMQHRLTKLTS